MNKREIQMPESSQDLSNASISDKDTNENPGFVADPTIDSHPGRILRAARDELNYSAEQIAQELHLRPSVVLAMEEEQYTEFSSDVFLKGYFRSYCRLVNLHEERMVELLDVQLKLRQKDYDDAELVLKKGRQFKKRKKALLALILVLVILGASAFILSIFYQESAPISKPVPSLNTSTESADDFSPNNIKAPESDLSFKKPKNLSSTEATIPLESEAALEVAKKKITVSEPKKNEIEEKLEISDVSTVSQMSAEPSMFEATFSGDCWFKFVDANQKTIFAALKHAGDHVSYSGLAPFKVVLGDASKVNLTFEGKSINLRSHTARNGRAQLTLRKG